MLLVLLFLFALPPPQRLLDLHPGLEYVLRVPTGYKQWLLSSDSTGSEWCYQNRGKRSDVEQYCLAEKPTYTSGTLANVEAFDESAARVVLKDGHVGWVARELIDMTEEQRKAYDAEQAMWQKHAAATRAMNAQRLAATRETERQQRAKEQAYVASLPKLRGVAGDVLVATSSDCARDYKKIIEFGRKNGTGVEYRKKLLELISLGCAVNIPSGTALKISRQDQDFVEFCAYDGSKAGTCGVALREDVH